jgi:hypothetical protein
VGLLDILRGQRTPKRANLESLFAISTAYPTLSVNLGLASTGRSGVCFKSIEAGDFTALVRELDELLRISGSDTGTTIERHQDEMGFSWVVLTDQDFDDLVTTTHLVNQSIGERGYGDKLLCSVFGFRGATDGEPVDLVYAYKRGTFYPFAPRGDRRRDNALELRLQAALAGEMPMEPELERWYPVWDAPVADPA